MATLPAGGKPAPRTSKPAGAKGKGTAGKTASAKPKAGKKAIGAPQGPRAPNADKIKQDICHRLETGTPLREICRDEGMPAWRTVYDWIDADEAFAAAIARAREAGYDAIAEKSLELVDEEPERGPDNKIDPGWVAHQRLRAEHRLKLLAKWSPKKYGDKLTQEHTGPNGSALQVASTVTFVRPPSRQEEV